MDKEIISDAELQSSFFYPACEADFFPLFHFEYPVFIYVDYMYNTDFIESDLQKGYLSGKSDAFQIVNDPRSFDLKDILDTNDFEKARKMLGNTLSEKQKNSLLAFSEEPRLRNAIRIFDLEKSSGKKCKLLYFQAEGMLTYLLLFKNGLKAPKTLCTTITGQNPALEEIFPLLFPQLKELPGTWITYNSKSEMYPFSAGQLKWEGSCDKFDAEIYCRKQIPAFSIFSC